jgi:hypothetical protein
MGHHRRYEHLNDRTGKSAETNIAGHLAPVFVVVDDADPTRRLPVAARRQMDSALDSCGDLIELQRRIAWRTLAAARGQRAYPRRHADLAERRELIASFVALFLPARLLGDDTAVQARARVASWLSTGDVDVVAGIEHALGRRLTEPEHRHLEPDRYCRRCRVPRSELERTDGLCAECVGPRRRRSDLRAPASG